MWEFHKTMNFEDHKAFMRELNKLDMKIGYVSEYKNGVNTTRIHSIDGTPVDMFSSNFAFKFGIHIGNILSWPFNSFSPPKAIDS